MISTNLNFLNFKTSPMRNKAKPKKGINFIHLRTYSVKQTILICINNSEYRTNYIKYLIELFAYYSMQIIKLSFYSSIVFLCTVNPITYMLISYILFYLHIIITFILEYIQNLHLTLPLRTNVPDFLYNIPFQEQIHLQKSKNDAIGKLTYSYRRKGYIAPGKAFHYDATILHIFNYYNKAINFLATIHAPFYDYLAYLGQPPKPALAPTRHIFRPTSFQADLKRMTHMRAPNVIE